MDLHSTLAERADDLTVPADLLDRVETGARRVRRRRAVVTGSAVAALVAVAAVAAPLATRSGQPARLGPAGVGSPCTGPSVVQPPVALGTAGAAAAPAAGVAPAQLDPANVLGWSCRGGDLALLAPALNAFQADGSLDNGGVGPFHALWEGRTAAGTEAGIFELWSPGGTLAHTVTVVQGSRTSDVVLPAGTAAIVTRVPGRQPGGAIGGDSEGLLVVAAPDVTKAVYDDGLGHDTPLALTDGVFTGLRAAVRSSGGREVDGVTLTRPSGTVRIGVDDQSSPTTTTPAVGDLSEHAARRALAAAGLDGGADTTAATLPLAGTSPAAGTVLRTGTRVALTYALPSQGPATTAPAAEALSYPVPKSWAFRGDLGAFDRLTATVSLVGGITPLWAGTLDGSDAAVVLVKTGDAAGDITIETWLPGPNGPFQTAGKQTLIDGIHAYAATLPDGRLLILGPPGTSYLSYDTGTSGGDLASFPAPSGAAAIPRAGDPATITLTAADATHRPVYSGTVSTRDTGSRD